MGTILVATNANELAESQRTLIEKFEAAKQTAIAEAAETKDACERAITAGMSRSQMTNLMRRASARVGYLSRCLAALKSGYAMMPDMPGQLFAVRVGEGRPRRRTAGARWSIRDVRPHGLPAGEGQYVNPEHAMVKNERTRTTNDGREVDDSTFTVSGYFDLETLSAKFTRPQVIERISDALQDRVFDELQLVGASGSAVPNRDPIVLGRVVDPVNRIAAAFLVAWFVDPDEAMGNVRQRRVS